MIENLLEVFMKFTNYSFFIQKISSKLCEILFKICNREQQTLGYYIISYKTC